MITDRESLAAAMSTVDGVTGYKRRPDVLTEGIGYPLRAYLTRGPAATWMTNWRLIFIHGGDEWAADDWIDLTAPLMVDALRELVFVDNINPIAFPTEAGDLFATEIIARSE